MKELKQLSKDKVVITKQAQQEKQQKLVGRIRPYKGHTLFEVNLGNGNVMEAKIEEPVADYLGRKLPKKVIVNKNCIYVSALNVKSLMKKLVKKGIIKDE